jgi:hypothetical protein
MSDVFIDGGGQLRHASEHPAAQPLGSEVAEETLDHDQPRCRVGSKAHVKTRMLGQPLLHGGMFVRGIVVGDGVIGGVSVAIVTIFVIQAKDQLYMLLWSVGALAIMGIALGCFAAKAST